MLNSKQELSFLILACPLSFQVFCELRTLGNFDQKDPRVSKNFVRNSGAGNGCVNFMEAWKNAFFLQEKPMSIKFLVLGGGGIFWVFGGGGGKCRFYFYGRGDFSEIFAPPPLTPPLLGFSIRNRSPPPPAARTPPSPSPSRKKKDFSDLKLA